MTLGIVVFGAAFLVGLGLGTYTRRPLSTAFLVLGSFTALLVLSATGEVFGAAAVLAIVVLARARRGDDARDLRAPRRPLETPRRLEGEPNRRSTLRTPRAWRNWQTRRV